VPGDEEMVDAVVDDLGYDPEVGNPQKSEYRPSFGSPHHRNRKNDSRRPFEISMGRRDVQASIHYCVKQKTFGAKQTDHQQKTGPCSYMLATKIHCLLFFAAKLHKIIELHKKNCTHAKKVVSLCAFYVKKSSIYYEKSKHHHAQL
jgi:hypothetical protein